jgi:hypothetical protein
MSRSIPYFHRMVKILGGTLAALAPHGPECHYMQPLRTCLVVACMSTLGLTASAQIIATSLPSEPEKASPKKWAIHVMASPLAQWRYNEVFLDFVDPSFSVAGDIVGRPRSRLMIAAEASFGRADGLVLSAGGWYNELGAHTFDVTALVGFPATPEDPDGYVNLHYAAFRTDLSMLEYHVGVSYKGFGLQAGVVSTSGEFTSGEFVSGDGRRFDPPIFYPTDLPKADTTDYDLFLVYRRGLGNQDRASLALGVGGYRKQAIRGVNVAPLRTGDTKTVLSAFAAAGLRVYKGLGLDASYWFVGPSDAPDDVAEVSRFTLASDQQSRLTIGVGFTF